MMVLTFRVPVARLTHMISGVACLGNRLYAAERRPAGLWLWPYVSLGLMTRRVGENALAVPS